MLYATHCSDEQISAQITSPKQKIKLELKLNYHALFPPPDTNCTAGGKHSFNIFILICTARFYSWERGWVVSTAAWPSS
jgi:hypothetical protein